MSVMGNIASISRGSLHDGEGIRSVVYFKGCPLRCKWCHNPEMLEGVPTPVYSNQKCMGCGDCATVCAHRSIKGGELILDREGCIRCGKCADICPTGAISLCGERLSADEVFAEIIRDEHYFRQSGGGVTLSGGECLMQADFAAELLCRLRERGIHTAIETSLCVPYGNIEKVLPYADMIFADLKHHDPHRHAEFTGKPNDGIIDNLRRLSAAHRNITLRIPLIPGVNDSEADMDSFGGIIRTLSDGVHAVELLRYNYLAESKYDSVGMAYHAFADGSQSVAVLDGLKARIATAVGYKCNVFFVM